MNLSLNNPANITPPDVPEVELRTFDAPLCALRREVDAALKAMRRVLRAFLACRVEDGCSHCITWAEVMAGVEDEIWRVHPMNPDADNMDTEGATQSTLATLAMALGITTVMLDPDEVEAWDAMNAERYAGDYDA